MSKTVKHKITVELPKPRDLSKNRPSVFQRLGTKKFKSLETAVNINTKPKESKITSTLITTVVSEQKSDNVELEDADPDSLEKKRAELQKELEIQLKMESSRKVTTKETIRKRKKVRSSSSSSSSSSDSGSSSDSSSSSSSKESKRKIRKGKLRKRGSSSSSDEPRKKVVKVKRICQKKVDGSKSHKSNHGKKSLEGKLRDRSQSPTLRKRIGSSPPKSVQKIPIKNKLSADNMAKHYRMKEAAREKEREREFQLRDRDRDKEKERERMRSRERARSRSPKMRPKSRTPKRLSRSREIKHKSPSRRVGSPPKSRSGGSMRRDRSIDRVMKKDFKRHDSRERERERREKERSCREDAREKERHDILLKCQERHERERLAREKLQRKRDEERLKSERLLPRPAERAMAIAAARDRSRDKSIDRDRLRSVSHSRSGRDRIEREKEPNPYDRVYERDDPRYENHDGRMEKVDRAIRDERDYIRRHDEGRPDSMSSPYLTREKRIVERDDIDWDPGVPDQRYDDHLREGRRLNRDYGSRSYIDDRHLTEREREWVRDNEIGRTEVDRGIYDRIDRHVGREWDRGDPNHTLPRDNYVDNSEWAGGINERQWENKGKWQQHQEDEENWDDDEGKSWQEYNRIPENLHHDVGIGGGMSTAVSNMGMSEVPRGVPNRRWNNWRGRRGSQHHSGDFRRLQDGMFQHDRSSMVYRRPPEVPAETLIQSTVADAVPTNTVTSTQQVIATKCDGTSSGTPLRSMLTQVAVPDLKLDDKKEEVVDAVSLVPDEQLLEEVIPDDLSEFSDEADEILNRQEQEDDLGILSSNSAKESSLDHNSCKASQFINESDDCGSGQYFRPDYDPELMEKQTSQLESNTKSIEPSIEAAIVNVQPSLDLLIGEPILEPKAELNESKDMPEEMDLDFEEISDGELEEEARIRGLGDALGVDWASLVEESKAIAREKSLFSHTSAKQRWQPHSILLDVGISHKWTGKSFAYKILNDMHQKLKEEKKENRSFLEENIMNDGIIKVKKEKLDSDYGDVTLKDEPITKEDDIITAHPIACVQVANRYNIDARKNLIFKATGPYSRALCARSDLQMRRILCELPRREVGCYDTMQKTDMAYFTMALSLFQRAINDKN